MATTSPEGKGPTITDFRDALKNWPPAEAALLEQWLVRGRAPRSFLDLWDLYWAEFGPLAPVPSDIHQLEEVLAR